MNRMSLLVGLAAALLCFEVSSAENPNAKPESITVPLDQIWAFRMPGTRDILQLEPTQSEVAGKRLWDAIILTLCADLSPDWPVEGSRAQPGFTVIGTGLKALRNTDAVLVKKKAARNVQCGRRGVASVLFLSMWRPR